MRSIMSQEAIAVSKNAFSILQQKHTAPMSNGISFNTRQDARSFFFCFRLRCFNEEDVLRVERAQRNLNVCSQVPKALVRRRFQPS